MSASCPICGKPAESPRTRPFCSTRCAEVDLGRWFTGAYVIPGPPPELDDDGDGRGENGRGENLGDRG